LRRPIDIEKCLKCYSKGNADVVITVTDAHRNPFFNMVTIQTNGLVELAITPTKGISRRQDALEVYDMTTVAYVADPKFVMTQESLFAGRVQAVHVPIERSIDIDTLLDFEIAEFLYTRGN